MYSHEPEGYVCPFCLLVSGCDAEYSRQSDVFYRDDLITAFIASHWWPNNPGHVLIIPNDHIENIYNLPPTISAQIHEVARQVAIALKQVYRCDGTSTRQHNEPAGYQEVWHYHLHVFPRYVDDDLYRLTKRPAPIEERKPYADKLRQYFDELNGK